MSKLPEINVWDPFVRMFHWVLVLAFALAFLSEEDYLTVHSWAGYLVFVLVLLRIVWGRVGPNYARFSNFVYPREEVFNFLRDTMHMRATRYLGHNPAAGVAILTLLALLLLTTSTGMLAYGTTEQMGPLAFLGLSNPQLDESFLGELLEEAHELFANLTLLLVFVHLFGVAIESVLHRENLVRAMISGRKRMNHQ